MTERAALTTRATDESRVGEFVGGLRVAEKLLLGFFAYTTVASFVFPLVLRQRLALVRALVRRPRVLLLDEPTAALDAAARTAVEEMLAARRAEGVAMLWVTHDADQAHRVASRRLVLVAGRVAEAA